MKIREKIEELKASVVKQWKIWREITKLRLAIKVTSKFHAQLRESCDNDKKLRYYIVLLERPVIDKKRRTFRKEEKLFWINRKNFQNIKRKGWMPPKMTCDVLRYHAFYWTDPRRPYIQDKQMKIEAEKRYREHLNK